MPALLGRVAEHRAPAQSGLKLPVFVLADGDLPQVFDSDYIPATYVVSPDGLVVYQHTGAALWDHKRVVAFLRGLAMKHVLPPPKSELNVRVGGS